MLVRGPGHPRLNYFINRLYQDYLSPWSSVYGLGRISKGRFQYIVSQKCSIWIWNNRKPGNSSSNFSQRMTFWISCWSRRKRGVCFDCLGRCASSISYHHVAQNFLMETTQFGCCSPKGFGRRTSRCGGSCHAPLQRQLNNKDFSIIYPRWTFSLSPT